MTKFCTHVGVSYTKPENFVEAYDNLMRTIRHVQSLLWVIHGTLSGQDNDVAEAVGLGIDLGAELDRRACVLFEFGKTSKSTSAEQQEEG